MNFTFCLSFYTDLIHKFQVKKKSVRAENTTLSLKFKHFVKATNKKANEQYTRTVSFPLKLNSVSLLTQHVQTRSCFADYNIHAKHFVSKVEAIQTRV